MILVCIWLTPRKPPPTHGHLLDFRPVLRNRAALGYIFGYGAHCFELYGMRTWIVAFWTFVVARNDGTAPLGAVTVSVIITLLSLPASVMGNEAALRYGRHRAITTVMIASGAIALAIGFNVEASPLLLLFLVFVYGLTVPADSGALTSGTTASAAPMHRGATLALHSTVGLAFQHLVHGARVALDAAGGPVQPRAWLALFVLLAAGIFLGLSLCGGRRRIGDVSWAIVGASIFCSGHEDVSQIAPALVHRNHRGALRLLPQRAVCKPPRRVLRA